MKTLERLLRTNETWLTEHVLANAKIHGYTEDSSTLEQSWRAAICGFSGPMTAMLEADQWPSAIVCNDSPENDLLFTFAADQARIHRKRGVSLESFVGLTKYYRSAYADLISSHMPADDEARKCRAFVDRFFDKVEISICSVWQSQTETDALRNFADANRGLMNEKNRYLTIFESLNDPVLILSEDRRVINLNLAANRLFDDKAISGQVYYRADETVSLNPQITAMIEAGGSRSNFEYDLDTRQGPRSFRINIQRILDVSDKFTGAVVILTDITDIRAAQRAAEAADRTKSVFLATMSHEIRTPINGILGIAQLLRNAPLKEKQSDYVDALLSSGELLLDLVNDVLDYTKLEAGEGAPDLITFSPRDMIERVVRLSMGEALRKGLQLDLDVAATCPDLVRGDCGKIQRILLNLVNNAVKFTRDGSVAIGVSATDGRLVFTVRDTGPGIPESDQQSIFKPFFQSATGGTEPHAGTGLGLAICTRLADLIHADLALETPTSGTGALFRLMCPITQAHRTTQPVAPEADAVDALNILLVEDNAINAMVIEGFLASEGHDVDVISDGEAALELLIGGAHDIILMDVHLRGTDGFEIIRRIRASDDSRLAALPILVLTADQSDATALRFSQSEADGFQAKPLNRDELRRAIQGVLVRSDEVVQPVPDRGSSENGAVLDASIIAEHREAIGLDRTDRILAAFEETARQHQFALRAAARNADPNTVAEIAHGLRSAAQMVGLIRLGRAAEATERCIGSGLSAGELRDEVETLCTEVITARKALRAHTGGR